ncbi:MAG: ABC transporter permease [Spirochaetales bacterium]|nr:ABC transporter permease [Spirochaetales bacterium]
MKVILLAWRNIFRQKRHTAATLLAVILGIAGLVVFEGFLHQLMGSFRDSTILSGIGHLQVASRADYWKKGEYSPYSYALADHGKVEQSLQHDPRVLSVFPSTGFTCLAGAGTKSLSLLVKAFPNSRMYFSQKTNRRADASQLVPDKFYLGHLEAGEEPDPLQTGELYLGATAARILGVRPGDTVTLMALLPEGGLNGRDFKIRGLFTSPGFDRYFAYTDYKTAMDFTLQKAPPVLHILLRHRQDTAGVAGELAVKFPQDHVKTWQELAVYYRQVNSMFTTFLTIIQAILMLVTLFLLANSMARSVLERRREWGTLRALGTPAPAIVVMVLLEGILLGGVGGLAGLGVGYAAAGVINLCGGLPFHNASQLLSVDVVPEASLVGVAVLPLLITGALAALAPAWQAVKTQPADSLRELA